MVYDVHMVSTFKASLTDGWQSIELEPNRPWVSMGWCCRVFTTKISSTTLFCRADPGNVLRLSNTLHGLWGLCYFRNAKQSGLELRHPDFFSSKTDEDNFSLEAWAASFIFPRSRFPRKCWFQKQVKLLLRRLSFLWEPSTFDTLYTSYLNIQKTLVYPQRRSSPYGTLGQLPQLLAEQRLCTHHPPMAFRRPE